MSDSIFFNLSEFEAHDTNVALHYANIITCTNKNMMYNLDTGKRVPKRVFDVMVKNELVEEYSSNPDHPVFGDLHSYTNGLGESIVEFGQDLDVLVSDILFMIKQSDDDIIEFAQQLYFVSPELLQALKVHPFMAPVMSRREIWEEMIRFGAKLKGQNPKIPMYFYIDRYYMNSVLPTSNEYYEEIPSMTADEIKGLLISIGNEQEFGEETIVTLQEGSQTHVFTLVLGIHSGYEIKS
jgi:hypothetical protein